MICAALAEFITVNFVSNYSTGGQRVSEFVRIMRQK
jgi:hypothetical protein